MLQVSCACSLRLGALDAGADHLAAMAVIVVEGEMLRAAIVPYGERPLRPSEPPGEILIHGMTVNVRQKPIGLRLAPAGDALGIDRVEIERRFAGFRMRDHGGMALLA